jgi:hypothetical protein
MTLDTCNVFIICKQLTIIISVTEKFQHLRLVKFIEMTSLDIDVHVELEIFHVEVTSVQFFLIAPSSVNINRHSLPEDTS